MEVWASSRTLALGRGIEWPLLHTGQRVTSIFLLRAKAVSMAGSWSPTLGMTRMSATCEQPQALVPSPASRGTERASIPS